MSSTYMKIDQSRVSMVVKRSSTIMGSVGNLMVNDC